jgi:hypothetical protein
MRITLEKRERCRECIYPAPYPSELVFFKTPETLSWLNFNHVLNFNTSSHTVLYSEFYEAVEWEFNI